MWMSSAKQIQSNGPGIANLATNGGPAPAPNLQHISKSAFAIDAQTEAQVLNLYSLLDGANQNVIREIAMLCVEISHPLHQRVNRMTVENLAIVFAPSFFRNPSDDTQDILLNSKNETKMTALLLAAVGQKYFSCDELDKIYYLLPPSQQLGGNLATGQNLGAMTPLDNGIMSPSANPTPMAAMGAPSFFNQASHMHYAPGIDDGRDSRMSGMSNLSSFNQTPPQNGSTYRPNGPSVGIPEHSTSPPSQSHFGSPVPQHRTPTSSAVPPPYNGPTTPQSTNSASGFFTSPAGPGAQPPGLPPRRGTFVQNGHQVLPQHPSQRNLGQ